MNYKNAKVINLMIIFSFFSIRQRFQEDSFQILESLDTINQLNAKHFYVLSRNDSFVHHFSLNITLHLTVAKQLHV